MFVLKEHPFSEILVGNPVHCGKLLTLNDDVFFPIVFLHILIIWGSRVIIYSYILTNSTLLLSHETSMLSLSTSSSLQNPQLKDFYLLQIVTSICILLLIPLMYIHPLSPLNNLILV